MSPQPFNLKVNTLILYIDIISTYDIKLTVVRCTVLVPYCKLTMS